MVSEETVSSEKEVAGIVLKGNICGKEKWLFVPFNENVSPVQRVKPEAVGYSLRRQSRGGRIELKFNILPAQPVVVKNTEVPVRMLTASESLEFANAFWATSPNAQLFSQQ